MPSMNWRTPALAASLVCPDCRMPLAQAGESLTCGRCGTRFADPDGVPDLRPPSRRAALEALLAGFAAPKSALRSHRLLRALLPPHPVFDPGRRARLRGVRDRLAGGLAVNLGAKTDDWGSELVHLDLAVPAGPPGAVDLLGDLERLPFADASLDGVVCTHVLEHLGDARTGFGEIARVVKPGGTVYVEVPFLFPLHPDPLDRHRWTLDGLRHELRAFEELEAGPSGGPFSTVVSVLPTLAGSILPGWLLFNVARGCLGWLLWPLKFLDLGARLSSRSGMAAPAFYFLGRRTAAPEDGRSPEPPKEIPPTGR
jgi:SAM-dependent methyltransferase